jgi:hypothetical protein
MQVYIWAFSAVGFLILFWLLSVWKKRLDGKAGQCLQHAGLGLFALAVWSILNFLGKYPILAANLSTEANIFLSLIAGIALIVGIALFFMAILAFLPYPKLVFRQFGFRHKFMEIAERINALPEPDDCDEFINFACSEIAAILKPDYYQVEKTDDSGRSFNIGEYYLRHETGIDERYEVKLVDEDDSRVIDDCRKCNSVRLVLSDDIGTSYSVKLRFRDGSGKLSERSRYDLIVALINTRLNSLSRMLTTKQSLLENERQNLMFRLADKSEDLASYLKKIFPVISASIECDYISVAVLDNAVQNMYRYSYVDVGGMLLERGICYPLRQTATQKVAAEKRMSTARTLESDFYRDDYYLHKAGFSSRLVYPIKDTSGDVKGVLTLASLKPRAYEQVKAEDLEFVEQPLCRLIEYHGTSNLMRNLKKQIVSSFNLTFGLKQKGELGDFYSRTAKVLSETLPATMCRIWDYDRPSNRLTSLAYHSLRGQRKGDGDLIDNIGLELLPRHKTAIEMGKALVVNQSNPENNMDEQEIKVLGLPGMKSAILAPMCLKEHVLGIVSIGELRNWERRSFGPQELLYAQIIATITALVNQIDRKNRSLRHFSEKLGRLEASSQIYGAFAEFPSRLSSPISAILGASQIIGGKIPEDAVELLKYNNIIQKSADTIVRELNKFSDVKQSIFNGQM